MSSLTSRHIFLTGFMGSGKTTLGRIAAQNLALDFYDLDEQIELRTMRSIRSLVEIGENAFREVEHRVLLDILDESQKMSLIALGGGTWIQQWAHFIIPPDRTIYLDTPFELICTRVLAADPSDRPLVTERQSLSKLFAERINRYLEAQHHFFCDHRDDSVEKTAERLSEFIRMRVAMPVSLI